jgi:multimeric flavodoxin WrbA
MRVTVIMGTLRRMYSYQLVKTLEAAIQETCRDASFTYVFFDEHRLGYCLGCGKCKDDESLCPIKDDGQELRAAVLASDLVILTSSVYVNNVSAVMKNFYDRYHYFTFRPPAPGKPCINLCVSSYSGLRPTASYMDWVARSFGFHVLDTIALHHRQIQQPSVTAELIQQANARVVRHFRPEGQPRYKPTLEELRVFSDQKTRIRATRDKYPKAYQYWLEKGWLSQCFYDERGINPVKRLLSRFLSHPLSRN